MVRTSKAVVFESPGHLSVRDVALPALTEDDVLVEVTWSGISTGTEKLLWEGAMPSFPGLAYPLVPGYESMGVVVASDNERLPDGQTVFIPGSRGFIDVSGLFGGAAKYLVVPSKRLTPLPSSIGETGVLLALLATAIHILGRLESHQQPDLVIGNGVLGRIIVALCEHRYGVAPVIWESAATRREHNHAIDPKEDSRTDYRTAIDVSGDASVIDHILPHLGTDSVIVLGGFYRNPVSFHFAPAFLREIDIRVAAEWRPSDLQDAAELLCSGALDLTHLITHRFAAVDAKHAYSEAFSNPYCLKTVLDWSAL